MRYTYEFKLECVEMYRKGQYPQTPEGLSDRNFHHTVRAWVRIQEAQGSEALKHKTHNKNWTPDEKMELVERVLSGESNKSVAFSSGINNGLLYQWVRKYKDFGYNGLVNQKKGRPSKKPPMKKASTPSPLNESEREELIRLRAEVQYIKAENEVIKKEIALREEKWAAQLKAKKQRSSKNSEKQDIS